MNPDTHETIVVVEDEARVRLLVARTLNKAGYNVLEAPDASTGFRLLEADAPHARLLLTDVVLPGTSGCDLFDRVRARWPHLPVLFMSGYPDRVLAFTSHPGEATGFLRKPFSPEQLRATVRRMLAPEECLPPGDLVSVA